MAQTANNAIAPRGNGSKVIDPTNMKPSAFFTSAAVQSLLTRTFKSDQKAAIVTSTLISILNISPRFQNCNALELLGNVLRYEIGMGLSWAMSDYAVIDYGGKPQFQLQYQGVAKMAFASEKYADGDWYEVREGEYKGLDPRTRRPILQWIENDEERLSKPIIGYYVWVQMVDERPYNGKIVGLYMSHDAILRHADTYSKPFQNFGGYDAYKSAMAGERAFIKNGNTPWAAPPDSTGHMKMCKKTVLLQLLKNPFLPKSNGIYASYIEADELTERTGVAPTFNDEYDRMAREAALQAAKEAPVQQIEAAPMTAPAPAEMPAEAAPVDERPMPAPEQATGKRGKQTKTAAKTAPKPAPVPEQPPEPDFPDMSGDPFPPDDLYPPDDPFAAVRW